MGIVHSPFLVRGPLATSLLLCHIFTSSMLNVATHPESQNCRTDMSNPVLRDGTRCVWRVARVRPVIEKMPVCVDVM